MTHRSTCIKNGVILQRFLSPRRVFQYAHVKQQKRKKEGSSYKNVVIVFDGCTAFTIVRVQNGVFYFPEKTSVKMKFKKTDFSDSGKIHFIWSVFRIENPDT